MKISELRTLLNKFEDLIGGAEIWMQIPKDTSHIPTCHAYVVTGALFQVRPGKESFIELSTGENDR